MFHKTQENFRPSVRPSNRLSSAAPHGWKLSPVFYRALSPLCLLPFFNLSMEKTWLRASNGQQYPLLCCTHSMFLKCAQQGRRYC